MRNRKLTITTARPEHAEMLGRLSTQTWCPDGDITPDTFTALHFRAHLQRFPQGQFIALWEGQAVGYAVTMRTARSPYAQPLQWMDAIGDMTLRNQHPQGEWLYGVDFLVHPGFRKRGIGTKLYRARFDLVKRLNLRGFYAGGMLAGYHKYQNKLSVTEYADAVRAGRIKDPTVSMQLNRGFRPQAVIKNYSDDPHPYDSAMLIVWDNPMFGGRSRRVVAQRA